MVLAELVQCEFASWPTKSDNWRKPEIARSIELETPERRWRVEGIFLDGFGRWTISGGSFKWFRMCIEYGYKYLYVSYYQHKLCSHIWNVERSCLITKQVLPLFDLCISSFRGCFLRRLDNCRLSAIHPCAPLAMKGAAPASSKQQMIRPNGGLLGGVCLGCEEPRIPHHGCWTHLEHWETKIRKHPRVEIGMYVQHHVPPFGLHVPDVSWFLMISTLIMAAASLFGRWQVYGRAPGKLGFDVSGRIGCGDWWSGVDQLWGSLVDPC